MTSTLFSFNLLLLATVTLVVTVPCAKCAGHVSPLVVRKEVQREVGKVRAQRAGLAHKWAGSSARVTERGSVRCTQLEPAQSFLSCWAGVYTP